MDETSLVLNSKLPGSFKSTNLAKENMAMLKNRRRDAQKPDLASVSSSESVLMIL
jgi:hypothetical protein